MPFAVTPPAVPWTAMHLEWSADYLPSARRAFDWQLLDTDFALPDGYPVPDADPDHRLAGRVLLSSAPASALAGLNGANGVNGDQPGQVPDADLLAGAFSDLAAQLRKDATGAVVRPIDGSAPAGDPPAGARPAGFVAFRAGFLRLDRLRLVDGFGRFLDLLPGGTPVHTGPGVAAPDHPELVALKPRFTAPGRVLFRYAAATGDRVDADAGVSPVCGYVAPSPLDGTLEFFDDAGTRLGRLRPDDTAGTAWEEDPGQPASLGALPSNWIPNGFLGRFADALLSADTTAAGTGSAGTGLAGTGPAGIGSAGTGSAGTPGGQTALQALVRIMDATRWTVDVTGRAGDEHLALLLASPVVVLRATILLDVQDPRRPAENQRTAVSVKLGTLAHQQDGLLGYVVDDDFSRVRVVDPAVAGAAEVTSPYVDTSDVFHVYPGTPVSLLLFVMPQTDVHVTTGLLPQKAVGMLREWTAPALAKLSPALRYGPVLRDPKVTRLPIPADIRGVWTWHRRPDPTSWASDEVVAANQSSVLPDGPQLVGDGWLSVTLIPDTRYLQNAIQVQVTHIRTRTYRAGHRQLLGIGGHNADGSPFLLPVQQVARLQESGRFAFYLQQPGFARRDLHVVTRQGTKYLRTVHDPHLENNLMALPEAPTDW